MIIEATYADLQTVEEAILDIFKYLITDIYNGQNK